jgi:CDP-diacylglycerol--glycerol-3-phosphate 3-phosphatidyltransferase
MTNNEASQRPSTAVMTLPNQITAARLLLSVVLFALIAWEQYLAGLVVFLVAVGTDWLDGYIARKYAMVSVVGRILDPFVDKVIICGTFIFLAAVPASGIVPWMAVVVVARELLVTALRGMVEGQGGDFSANLPGKWKMVLQSAAAAFSLAYLAWGVSALVWPLAIVVWAAVVLTVYSGWIYVQAAARMWKP